jgi:hypothetical protein
LVRLLLDITALTKDYDPSWIDDSLNPVYEAGKSVFGPGVKNQADEDVAAGELMNQIKQDANLTGNLTISDGPGFHIDTTRGESLGVHAVEFHADGLGTVLAFRPTWSSGDYDQMKMWLTKWTLSRMDAMFKHQWVDIAGLEWTDQMRSDAEGWDIFSRIGMMTLSDLLFIGPFLDKMGTLAGQKGLNPDEVKKTGYWEFTKAIAESVRLAALGPDGLAPTKNSTGEKLYLTGLSQGGSRAALVSMYFEKSFHEVYDTVTFGATGGLCFSRDLDGSDGHLLDDVDPYVMHEQIIDYVHPLDPWGNIDYDAGQVCWLGDTDLQASVEAEYCKEIYGLSAVNVVFSAGVSAYGLFKETDKLKDRCLYQTHSWMALHKFLSDNDILNTDGTTTRGCTMRDPIPKGDDRFCPSNDKNADGCDDEFSAKACLETNVWNGKCHWCPTTNLSTTDSPGYCRSPYHAYYNGCDNEWRHTYRGNMTYAGARHPNQGGLALAIVIALTLLSGGNQIGGR